MSDLENAAAIAEAGSFEREASERALREVLLLAADVLAFMVPATMFVEIKVVGRLFLSDILLVAAFPVLLALRWQLLRHRVILATFLFGGIWLASQMVTDVVRHSSFNDYARGWSIIVFSLIHIATLYLLLYRSRRRIVLYAMGLVVGGLLLYLINPDKLALDWPWKFGWGPPITEVLIILATGVYVAGSAFLAAGVIAFASLLNLYMGFRALCGVCFMGAAYVLVKPRYQRTLSKHHRRNQVGLWIALAIAALALMKVYDYGARNGALGAEAREKYVEQSNGTLGVLLGGRGEIFSSSLAIKDSPIIGHGSWAKDPKYALEGLFIMESLGYPPPPDFNLQESKGLIPSHSYFFGAWVDAGILGALFWAWIAIVDVRALSALYRMREPLTPLVACFGFKLLWDVLFSPYGLTHRLFAPYEIVLVLFVLLSAQTDSSRALHEPVAGQRSAL